MNAREAMPAFGWRVYGAGILALGLVSLAWGDFDPGQPVAAGFPARTALAYAAAALLVIAGAAIEWRRTTSRGSAALAVYYTLIVVLVMNGRVVLRHPSEYVAYSGLAEQLSLAAGALILYATTAPIDRSLAARIVRTGRGIFGVCALLFGGAHFVYLDFTVPLIPKWLPPSPEFWAYATGIAHIAAGLAIITGMQARLAAVLLTVMFASFTPLVHLPLLMADATNRMVWSENALNLALAGAAWVVADSLARSARQQKPESMSAKAD